MVCFGSSYDIVYVGSDNRGKGVSQIYRIAEVMPHRSFVIVGHVKNKTSLSNVHHLGYMQKANVAGILRGARLLVAPYEEKVSDNAGNDISKYMSPLKLFEYMASQRPFIISRSEFLDGIVLEDTHCLMAEAENIEEWAHKIDLLFESTELSEELASNANKLYYDYYTWEKRASVLLTNIL